MLQAFCEPVEDGARCSGYRTIAGEEGVDGPDARGVVKGDGHDAVGAECAHAMMGNEARSSALSYLVEDKMVVMPIERHRQFEIPLSGEAHDGLVWRKAFG